MSNRVICDGVTITDKGMLLVEPGRYKVWTDGNGAHMEKIESNTGEMDE